MAVGDGGTLLPGTLAVASASPYLIAGGSVAIAEATRPEAGRDEAGRAEAGRAEAAEAEAGWATVRWADAGRRGALLRAHSQLAAAASISGARLRMVSCVDHSSEITA